MSGSNRMAIEQIKELAIKYRLNLALHMKDGCINVDSILATLNRAETISLKNT